VSNGETGRLALAPMSVADFSQGVMGLLAETNIDVSLRALPNEIPNPIPSNHDQVHAAYDPDYANRYWRVLLQVYLALAVRAASDPDATLLLFLQSTYEAAARTADWDRAALEREPEPPT
jgi:hypothetical protein